MFQQNNLHAIISYYFEVIPQKFKKKNTRKTIDVENPTKLLDRTEAAASEKFIWNTFTLLC